MITNTFSFSNSFKDIYKINTKLIQKINTKLKKNFFSKID